MKTKKKPKEYKRLRMPPNKTHKTKKDYNRRDKSWRKQND